MKFATEFLILLIIILSNSCAIIYIQSNSIQQSIPSSSLDGGSFYTNAKENQNKASYVSQNSIARGNEHILKEIDSASKLKDVNLGSIERLNTFVEIDTFEANSALEFLTLVNSLNISGTGSPADPYLISGFHFVLQSETGSSISLNFAANYSIRISDNQFTVGGIFINRVNSTAFQPIQLQITNNTFNLNSNTDPLIEIQNSSINSIEISGNAITSTNATNSDLLKVKDPLIYLHDINSSNLNLLENTIQNVYSKTVAINNNSIIDTLRFNNNTIILKNQSAGDEILFENSTISIFQFFDNVIEVASNTNAIRTTVGLFNLTTRDIRIRKNIITTGNSHFTFHLKNIGTQNLGAHIVITENDLESNFTVSELLNFGQESFIVLDGKIWGIVEIKNNSFNEFLSSDILLSSSFNSFASIYVEIGLNLNKILLMITQGVSALWKYNITMGQTNVLDGVIATNDIFAISDKAFVAGEMSYGLRIENHTDSAHFYSGFLTIIETSLIFPSIQLTSFSDEGIIWEVMTENFEAPGFYSIYENGELVKTKSWESFVQVVFPVGTSQEMRNFTLEVEDYFGNTICDTVYRTILKIDFNVPEVLNKSYNFGESEIEVSWSARTVFPTSYSIYRNGTAVIANQLFEDNNLTSYDIERLNVGNYNFTVEFNGLQNVVKKTVFLEVEEKQVQSLEIVGAKTVVCVSFCEGKQVTWEFSRQINGSYTIYGNDFMLENGDLQNKMNLTFTLPTLPSGYSNLTLEILEVINQMTYKSVYFAELSILGFTILNQTTKNETTTTTRSPTSSEKSLNLLSRVLLVFALVVLFILIGLSLLLVCTVLVFIAFRCLNLIKKRL